MRYYFAPLEGITDSIYRQVHHSYFPGVDRYYMPFISPTIHRRLTHREERELPAADSVAFAAVPQVLTKVAEDFLWAAEVCAQRGYTEVNLNVGCPSGTVVSKGKGSGLLRAPEALDALLDGIFSRCPIPVSVKTRLGMDEPGEFPAILEVFNRYPIRELTVHPRVRQDFYRNPVREEWFRYAADNSRNPLCFNGNLTSLTQCREVQARYPGLEAVMLGRALIGDPGMLTPGGTERETLRRFHRELMERYTREFGSARNAMFRLKENWRYLLCLFENTEKLGKRLRKTTDVAEYRSLTHEIIGSCPKRTQLRPDW